MNAATRVVCLTLLAGLLAGCRTGLSATWADPSLIRPVDEKAFPDAPAVALYRADRVLLFLTPQGAAYTQTQEDQVIQIRAEAGKAFASVRIPVRTNSELLDLRARKIDPDGTVTEIPRDRILSQSAEAEGGKGVGARVFSFPDVKVGSRLEYLYTVETQGITSFRAQQVLARVPTVHYSFKLTCTKPVRYAVKAYNSSTPFSESDDGQFFYVDWSGENLPAHEEEPWAPHWTFDEPWWAYTVLQFNFGNAVRNEFADWSSASKRWAEYVYSQSKLYEGFTQKLPQTACESKACRTAAAVDFVHGETDFTGYGEFNALRPLKDVLQSHQASGFEKAVLLRRVMADAGVTALIAVTTRSLTQLTDATFPIPRAWNHLLVYAPAQEGLDKALWIDPSCEYCQAGQLPETTLGADALVIYPPSLMGNPKAVYATAEAAPGAPNRQAQVYDAKLDGQGRLEVTVSVSSRGPTAGLFRLARRGASADMHRKSAQALVTRLVPTAQLGAFTEDACDKRTGECRDSYAFSLPGYAAVDGDKLLLPLTFLGSLYEQNFSAATRKRDVVIQIPFRRDETVRIALPPGYAVSDLPDSSTVSAPGFRRTFSVEKETAGLVIHRSLVLAKGRYAPENYAAIRALMRGHAADRERILVLVRRPPAG